MVKKKRKIKIKEISFESIKGMKVGEVRELTKKFKVPNLKLVKSYGREAKL